MLENNQKPQKYQILFAALIFTGYCAFLLYLIYKASEAGDETWEKYLYLFAGFEVIVFTAVGFVFGTEVNRTRAVKAETDRSESAEKEKQALEKAKEAEMNGKNLAQLVLNKVEKTAGGPALKIRGISAGNVDNELLDLAHYAKKVYPELEV